MVEHRSAAERALAHIEQRAAMRLDEARATVARRLACHDLEGSSIIATLAERARVTLNFHPDRLLADGVTVAEGLLRDGRYRSQFDTGVTSGSPTAFPGGPRDQWEDALFGGAYHDEHGQGAERPKYGAFNVMRHADGASPRFGSCYFELSRAALRRCTFTWGDTYESPEPVGTLDVFELVLAAWLEAVETNGAALGVTGLDLPKLASRIAQDDPRRVIGRALDDYIEAQVHGPIDLAGDVDTLVIDPAFDGTAVGEQLAALSRRYDIRIERHAGFVLRPDEVPSDFRGPRMPALAERVTGGMDREFDAATLGRAAASLIREPATWSDWGTREETWQNIKQLWHVLVRFGRARGVLDRG